MKSIGQKVYTSWYGNMSNIYDRNRVSRRHACIRLGFLTIMWFWLSCLPYVDNWGAFQDWAVPWLASLLIGYHWWVVISDIRVVLKLSKPFRKRIWRPMYIVAPEKSYAKLKNFVDREALYRFWDKKQYDEQ